MFETNHYHRPLGDAMLKRSNPSWTSCQIADQRQRDNDARFVRALALAFLAGDHLPKGTAPMLRLIG